MPKRQDLSSILIIGAGPIVIGQACEFDYSGAQAGLDMPGETTVTHIGERSVPVRTTGHEKNRFTVVLAAMADGRKLKPYVVFKGVRPIAELNKVSGVVVALSKNGWMRKTDYRLGPTLLGETELWTATASLGCLQVPSDGQCKRSSEKAGEF